MAAKQAEAYKLKGNAAFQAGNHGEAIEFYTYATELDPNNAKNFTNRSLAYFKMNKFDKSLRDAKKSCAKDPNWHKGPYRAGAALMEMGEHKEAHDYFKQAEALKPDLAIYRQSALQARAAMMDGMSLGDQLKQEGNEKFKAGDCEQAVVKYTDALAACKPDESELKCAIYANRAACYRQLYLSDKVVEDCTEALKLNDKHVKALIRRGQGYEALERFKYSYLDYKRAHNLSYDSNAGISHTRVSSAMRKLGMDTPSEDKWKVCYK